MPRLKRILMVEDEPETQKAARLALQAVGGFKVCTCSSTEEARECAEQFAPDLILLDARMRTVDGPTALRALRAIPGIEHIPVIVLTAKPQPREVDVFRELGAIDMIPKPFDPMTLADTVKAMWLRYTG